MREVSCMDECDIFLHSEDSFIWGIPRFRCEAKAKMAVIKVSNSRIVCEEMMNRMARIFHL